MRTGLINRIYLLLSLTFVAMLLLPAAGFALETTPGETSSPAPTIQSDLPDYAPGETVILTGQNWQPGESVHIYVNDDEGQTWNRNADVTADENGEIRDEFQLPDHFVATYSVVATGEVSGEARTTFTDGNVRVNSTPGGTFFDLAHSQYSGLGCAGNPTETESQKVGSTAGTRFQKGVGNTEAIRFVAEPVSDDGRPFLNWSSPDSPASPFIQNGTFDPNSSARIICVDGFGTGIREYRANYATGTSANDAPVNLVPGPQTTNENTALTFTVANDNHILTSDVDAGTTNPVQVTLSVPNGALTLSRTNGLTFLTGDGTNDPNMTFTGTISNINTALDGMSFTPATGFSGTTGLSITTNDQGFTGTGGTKTDTDTVDITVNNTINDPPVIDLNGGEAGTGYNASFTEDGGPVAAVNSTALTISDDDANLTSATVKITNLQDGTAESLDATVSGSGIMKSYDSSTGVLTLNGSATVAQYQQVLRTVSYNNTSQNPGTTSRGVTFVVNDGALDSNTATSTVAVNAVNDAPTISNVEDQTILEDGTTGDLAFTVSDVDNAVGSLTLSGSSEDTTLVPNAGITFGGTGANRTVEVTPAANRFGGPATVTVTVSDGDENTADTFDLTVTAVNDAPSFTKGDDQTVTEDAGARIVPGWATGISAGPFETQNVSFEVVDNTNPSLFSAQPEITDTGDLTYTPAANAHGSATVTVKAADDGGTANGGQNESAAQSFRIIVTSVNDAPKADDDSATTAEDTATDIAVLANDSDVDGDSLNVSSFTQPGHGTVSQNTDGTLKYMPAPDYHGSDSFTYKAKDASLDSNTATVSITVNPVNDKPVAEAQTVSTDEDTSKQIILTGTDVDGDSLTYEVVSGPVHGTLSGTGANLAYEPAANYHGADSFTFKVNDGSVYSEPATVDITVNPVNDRPVAVDDSGATDEDTATSINVKANDTDVDNTNAQLSVSSFDHTSAQGGTVSLENGELKYEPAANFNGNDSFKYQVSDGSLDSENEATVSVTVKAVNDAPVADDDSATTDEDTPLVINDANTLAADDDKGAANEGGQTLTVTEVSNATHGTVDLSDGKITFTPDANYHGPASFDYKVCDDGKTGDTLDAKCDTGTVNVTVNSVNDDPTVKTAASDDNGKNEGALLSTEGAFEDVDNDTLTITKTDGAGTLVDNGDGTWSWSLQTDDDVSGSVTVTASDGNGGTVTDSFDYSTVNVAPTVSFTGGPTDPNENKNGSETYTFSVSDPGNDGFTVKGDPDCGTGGSFIAGSLVTTANGGSFDCRFSDDATPRVRIQVRDADEPSGSATADSNVATRDVTVHNVAPKINLTGANTADEGDTKTYSFDITDPGDDTFSFASGTTNYPTCGANGELVGTPDISDGQFQCFFPDGDSFTDVAVRVADDDGGVSMADIEHVEVITVQISNVAPTVTAPATQSADEGASTSFGLGSFTDPGSDSPWTADVDWGDGSLVESLTDKTAQGSLGNASHTYADGPAARTVTVTVTDKDGASDAKTFTVNVANVAPTAVDDNPDAVAEGGTVTLNVLSNDTDPGDDALSVTDNTNGQHGTVDCDADGSCAYTPGDPDFFGADSFTYTVSDGDGGNDEGKVNVEVYEVNDAPVGANDTKSTPENTPLVFPASDLVNNDDEGAPNESGQTLTVTEVDNPVNGTVDLANGQITFTPDADYNGPASFKYTVCDDGTTNGASDPLCEELTAVVNVTVSPVNSRPEASNGADSMDEDADPITIDFALLVSDKETSDANLTYDIGSIPAAQGTLSGTGSTRAFDSADNFNGTVDISYTVTDRGDPDGCSAPAPCDAPKTSEQKKVTITVNPINDAPVAVNDSVSTDEDTPATGNVLDNDTDVDNVRADLTATEVAEPAHGTLALVPGGSFTYTPDANYHGSDSFTYEVSDGALNSNVATVDITVRPVNDAPKIDSASGPSSVDEGDTRNYSVSASDIENDQLAYKWTVVSGPANIPGADHQSSADVTFRDNGPVELKVTVSDGNGGTDTNTFTITAANAVPTITGITSTSQNVLAGTVNSVVFTGTATDPSPADTNAGFSWQWSLDGGAYGPYGSANANTFRTSFSTCGSHSVSAQARDKDLGVSAPFTTNAVNAYNGAYKAPLVDGTVNKVQKGQVVPVKISVGCGTTNLTGLSPHIQLLNGNQSPENETGGTAVTTSVSSADTGQTMRVVDGGYIYNLRVPSDSTATMGKQYTIRVNPFGETANHNASGMYIVLEIRK